MKKVVNDFYLSCERIDKKIQQRCCLSFFENKKILDAESISLEAIASIIVNPECVGIRVYLDGSE